MQVVQCENCGNTIDNEMRYCPKCGEAVSPPTLLEGPPAPDVGNGFSEDDKREPSPATQGRDMTSNGVSQGGKPGRRFIAIIVSACTAVLLLACIFGVAFCSASGNKAIGTWQTEYMANASVFSGTKGTVVLVIKEDGTFTSVTDTDNAYMNDTDSGEWSLSQNALTIRNGRKSYTFTISDDGRTMVEANGRIWKKR